MPLRETDIFELPLVFICLERVTGMLWTRDLRRGTNWSFQCQRQSHRVGDSETAKLRRQRNPATYHVCVTCHSHTAKFWQKEDLKNKNNSQNILHLYKSSLESV